MATLEKLPKVLFKPREFYESLEATNPKEGVFMLIFSLVLSLLLYGIFSSILGTSAVLFNFGLGWSMSPLSLFAGFLKALIFLFIGSWIADKTALFLGGRGSLDEIIGMFGYSEFLAFPKALTGIFLLTLFHSKFTGLGASGISSFFSGFVWGAVIIAFFFAVWEIWLKGTAVSVEHDLSFLRGAGSAVVSWIAIVSISLLFKFLGGFV